MSMPSWPTTLLNASNRRLREEIESKAAALLAVQHSCAESRDVVKLLKDNIVEVEKEKKLAAKTVAEMEGNLAQKATDVKQYANQAEAGFRQQRQKEEEYARLSSAKQLVTDAVCQRRAALQQRLQESRELEAVAKMVVEYSLARQREGEELEAAKAKLSSSVWQKLDRLHLEIAKLEKELAASQEEQESAFRELEVVQRRLHDTLRDHRENVGSLESVHQACHNLDLAIAASAAKMAALQTIKHTYTATQKEIAEALESQSQHGQQLARARDRARSEYDRRVFQLRRVVEGLQTQATEIDTLRRRHRAEAQHRHAQVGSAQLVQARWRDWQSTLAQQQEYHRLLSDTVAAIRRQLARHPVPSPEAIQSLFDTLSRQRGRVEDRLERMQVKLNDAVQQLFDVSQSSEAIGQKVTEAQAALKAASQQVDAHRAVTNELRNITSAIDADIATARAGLPALLARQKEQSQQRRTELEAQVTSLRDELQQHQGRHRQLLQETTTLRSQYMHAQRLASEENNQYQRAVDTAMSIERDLAAVGVESAAVSDRHRAAGITVERAGVTLRALSQAADQRIESVKASAGLADLLRAQVVAEEEKLDAEQQGTLLELHLQQNALHEQIEALQRCVRRRDLIRQRYEETMTAMARSMEAPLQHTEAAEEAAALMPSTLRAGAMGMGDDGSLMTPEALHARLILRRSYEREQLMRRGNALDLQLLSLEKETAALRRTLDTLRVECQQRPLSAVAALKRRARSAAHFGTDRTNRPAAPPRTASTHAKAAAGSLAAKGTPSRAARTQVALTDGLQVRAQALREEVAAETGAVDALRQHRVASKRQLEAMRRTLHEAKAAERQKQTQLQRLRDDVRRETLQAIHSAK